MVTRIRVLKIQCTSQLDDGPTTNVHYKPAPEIGQNCPMKRSVLALAAAAVIAGLPLPAVMAGNDESGASPSTPGQSVTESGGSAASDDPAATTETTTPTTTVAPPPPPPPVPVPGAGDNDDDDDDD